ncbi:lysophosphatidylcholine acyltransferase 2-like isoform X1 [Pollicipes pollicipes]|uniref:lysophosphatidylcholine acyltransferase 2-like isoform X1 n=1 Tax=Pollicipes pollicipes TaxID=41117 RepID=UPI001884F349|nr:lysophosphatidylcholine acyltransferase 2-like isoform X1 [Pollicipes pollicipes]XP_037085269.1 lysophosphatidylcholine acyltransferase 2-like isoform X1 [Pollicipes pollicipes]
MKSGESEEEWGTAGCSEQDHLIPHEVLNPFVMRLDALNSTYDKVKVAVLTVFVLPLRIVGLCLCVLFGWVFACIGLYGLSEEDHNRPLRGWRRWLRWVVLFCTRSVFVSAGFPWVSVRGQRADAVQAPVLVVAPHSSYFDVLPVIVMAAPSVVAKIETSRSPMFGKLIDYTQPVYVSREDPNSRQNTIREIQRRAHSGGEWPQILLFPEGTCTNRSCLIQFKPGAFYPGAPVQPVVVRYPNRLDTVTWTWEGPGAWKILWLTLTQFVSFCEIEYLPVYVPSDEEKENPRLYAHNVRAKMAEALGVPVTDYTYDDCRLMSKARANNLPCETGLVEVTKLMHQLGINMSTIEAEMESFAEIARKTDGLIRLTEFAAYLGIPTSEPGLVELFNLYDSDRDGVIDFREYLLGVSLISKPCNTEETIRLAFRLFDLGGKGHVTQRDVTKALAHTLSMTEQESARLFQQVQKAHDDYITFEEFRAHAQKKPEYAKIFLTWHGRMTQEKEKSQ